MKNLYKIIPMSLIMLSAMVGCDFFEDLDVENNNTPDRSKVYSDPNDFGSIIGGGYAGWWSTTQKSAPQMPLAVAAEVMSASWGNWGMWYMGEIPRNRINNTQTWPFAGDVLETPWYGYNGDLASINNVVNSIVNNKVKVVIEGKDLTDMSLANSYVVQGLNLGHLGLLFDKAFAATEDSDLAELDFSPYTEVVNTAISSFDKAIEISNRSTFTSDASFIPGYAMTNIQLSKFANSYAARVLVGSARTKAETEALDWNKILNYAKNGIDFDFAPVGDGGFVWWDRIKIQGQDAVWARVSQRVINMMAPTDPNAVYPWPNGVGSLPAVTQTQDKRLESDMAYSGAPSFNATRGYYFFSSYRYKRFDAYRATFATPMACFLKAENDLIHAEALVRTGGSKVTAADLINNTRVTRGGLAPLNGSESNADLLKAIMYERYIELGWTSPQVIWFDRRRVDELQPNSPLQLPVPAKELDVLGLPGYSFGGSQG
jgi:hypothetical protein